MIGKLLLGMAVLAATPAFGDCGVVGEVVGICDLVEKTDGQLRELREALEKTANAAIRAIPGERYLQLVDDLNGPDSAKATAARAFLAKLAGAKEGATYQATSNAAYETVLGSDGMPVAFKLDMLRARSPTRETVAGFSQQNSINVLSIQSAGVVPKTMEQVRQAVKAKADAWVQSVFGDVTWRPSGILALGGFSNSVLRRESLAGTKEIRDSEAKKFEAEKAAIAAQLGDLVESMLTIPQAPDASLGPTIPWDPVIQLPYIFLIIDKQTYESFPDFSIDVAVTELGNSNVTFFHNRPPFRVTKRDFDPKVHKPVTHDTRGDYYWTFVEVTGELNLTPELVAELDALKKSIAAIEKPQ
ncbi:MAG: hypothetical protein EOS63_03545 [Mesorhizobium sp.]|uniref:hypothetical protein n=1 Tax=Mesorhizobium sp. TaxID=1871066 RepID=UPI000FE74677|nr:hypothetical protein [Mesorhizobium sp.]RWE84207.1 MAG: hypothetical protein EOS63_03545 [Mesorhizobium sp.]TJW64625.1 MAG: hypothetical protein E5V97_06410 [Mesorhizobium sp.]